MELEGQSLGLTTPLELPILCAWQAVIFLEKHYDRSFTMASFTPKAFQKRDDAIS